jgi:hypothetical protein
MYHALPSTVYNSASLRNGFRMSIQITAFFITFYNCKLPRPYLRLDGLTQPLQFINSFNRVFPLLR